MGKDESDWLSELEATRRMLNVLAKLPTDEARRRVAMSAAAVAGLEVLPRAKGSV